MTMDEEQSLNSLLENELCFDTSYLDCSDSFHDDELGYTKIFQDSDTGNDQTKSPTLTSAWLNGFASFGQTNEQSAHTNNVLPSDIEAFASNSQTGGLTNNEFSANIPLLINNLMNNPPVPQMRFTFPESETKANDKILVENHDFAASSQYSVNHERKNMSSPKKRKLSNELTGNDQKDGYVGNLDAVSLDMILKGKSYESFEASRFGGSKARQSESTVCSGDKERAFTSGDKKRRKQHMHNGSTSSYTEESQRFSGQSGKSRNRNRMSSRSGRTDSRSGQTGSRSGPTGQSCSSTSSFPIEPEELTPVGSPTFAEVPSIDTTEYINDKELVTLSTKSLNKRVKHLPKPIVEQIKHQRRTLKNRGYAKSCRDRKINETCTLQKSNGDLERELSSVRFELQLVKVERDDLKRKYVQLLAAIKKRGIQL